MEPNLKDTFETLNEDFTANYTENDLIYALNDLPADERNLMIQFIECDCFYSKLARRHNISTQLLKRRLNEIRQHLIEIYETKYK